MPAGGYLDVGVGDVGVVLEDAARAGECETRLEVPEGVAVEVGACGCVLVERLKTVDALKGSVEAVPANQRRRHGSCSVFHCCQILVKKGEEGAGI